jgi:hypothetical protein
MSAEHSSILEIGTVLLLVAAVVVRTLMIVSAQKSQKSSKKEARKLTLPRIELLLQIRTMVICRKMKAKVAKQVFFTVQEGGEQHQMEGQRQLRGR